MEMDNTDEEANKDNPGRHSGGDSFSTITDSVQHPPVR